MTERLALDSSAVIVWFRSGNLEPLPLHRARRVFLPLPLVGELYVGVYSSRKRDSHLELVEKFIARHDVLVPDLETARLYGTTRARQRLHNIRASKMNDLWIAALCLQHDLPLLTNDRGFDSIGGLDVIHW